MKKFSKTALFLSTLLLASCSLDPPSQNQLVNLKIEAAEGTSQKLAESNLVPQSELSNWLSPSGLTGGNGVGAMTLNSLDFNCWMVNVMGPGIPDRDGHAEAIGRLPALYSQTSYCSYPGIISPPLQKAFPQSTTLQVPSGDGRIVQMVGVQESTTSNVCSGGALGGGNTNGGSEANFFEIGRAVVNLFSDTSVDLLNTFDSLNSTDQLKRKLNCGGESGYGPSDVAGLAYWFDGVTFNPTYQGVSEYGKWVNSLQNSTNYLTTNPSTSLPTKLSSCLGNKPCTSYQTDDYLYLSNPFSGAITELTIFVVGAFTNSGTNFIFRISGSSDLVKISTNGSNYLGFVNAYSSTGLARDTLPHLFMLRWKSGEYHQFKVDGVVGSTPGNTISTLTLNSSISAGDGAAFTGNISEVAVFSSAISSIDENRMNCYFKGKYGINQNIPCVH